MSSRAVFGVTAARAGEPQRKPGCVFAVVWLTWRNRLHVPGAPAEPLPSETFDRFQLGKALAATAVLLFLFASPVADENGVLLVAGALLISRKLRSRDMLGMVDWHLLVLIASLFIVTDALAQTGLPALLVDRITAAGLLPDRLATMAPLALIASNTIGNVPAVIMILSVWPEMPAGTLYALAVLTTLAGNFILIGSLANLIVAERAAAVGVRLSFLDHARCGVPITVLSMAIAVLVMSASGGTGLWAETTLPPLLVAAVIAALVTWRHRSNLARIRAGTEPKKGSRTADPDQPG